MSKKKHKKCPICGATIKYPDAVRCPECKTPLEVQDDKVEVRIKK